MRDVAVVSYAAMAVDLVDGPVGLALLGHLRAMTARFKAGLIELGFETLAGEHPVLAGQARLEHGVARESGTSQWHFPAPSRVRRMAQV